MDKHQIQALNYCAHAVDDLRATAAMLQRCMPQSARVLYRLMTMLQNSVKFVLPNCCELVAPDELRQAHLDLLRLPFPCTAFEVSWDREDDGIAYLGDFKQTPVTKRIALCWDARQFEPLPGLNSLLDVFPDGGVFVLPIYWGPEHRQWTVAMGGAFVPYGGKLSRTNVSNALPATQIAYAARCAAGLIQDKSMELRAEPFAMLPEFYESAVAAYGSHAQADAQIILDASDEVMVLIQACSVINCANVRTAELGASPASNKKRRANGKQPFFSYKVLQLAEDHGGRHGVHAGGHHAAARMHLRRGHLRQLENKVVWVRPAMVNAGTTQGQVEKDYSVMPERARRLN